MFDCMSLSVAEIECMSKLQEGGYIREKNFSNKGTLVALEKFLLRIPVYSRISDEER